VSGRLERERERVAGAARRLAADGLVTGTAGNVSIRTDDLVAVTPTGARLEDVTAERPTEIELISGALVREAERAGVEVPLQTALYRLVRGKEASYSG